MLLLIGQTHHSAVDRNDLEKNICGLENKRLHINACKKMSFYAFYVFNTLQFIEPV